MNEGFENNNFENNTNNGGEFEGAKQTPPPYSQPFTPPVTPPNQQYTPPTYNQYGGPYGYVPPQQPEAKKKPSKGKKKGLIIAIAIVCAVFLIGVAVMISGFIFDGFSEEVPQKSDDTQMNIVETPSNKEEVTADGVLSSKQVYEKVYQSSVGVLVYTKNQQSVYSEGTGIVMGENDDGNATYIITCAHVIDVSNAQILVQTEDGTQYNATVVGKDSKTDIGVLKISATGLSAAEFADSATVGVGDYVYAIGNPGGTQFFGSFTNGMVSAIGRPVDSPVGYEVACIQHTAAINPGNSGGALVNEYGQVIGINSSKIASTEYEGMGFAVPSSTVKEIVDELIKNGKVTNRPVLGIQYYKNTSSQVYSIIVQTHHLPAGSIIIDQIMVGSDLANTEVKTGDMIIAVNGKDMDTDDVLADAIENGKVGDQLKLTICRVDSNYNISQFDVTVKLVEDSSTSEVVEEETTDYYFPFPFGE